MKLRSLAPAATLGACALLSTAAPAHAEIPTAASSHVPVAVKPQYVHNAYPGGYASHAECMNTLVSVAENGTWTPGPGTTWAPRTIGASTYEEPMEDASCWQLPSGRWSYGAVGFIVNPNSRDHATFAVQMKTSGYTTYRPMRDAWMHRSARYATDATCERTRNGVIASIVRSGGRPIHAGPCVEVISNNGRSDIYSYGQLSYQGRRAAIRGDYRVSNPYFVMKTNWLT